MPDNEQANAAADAGLTEKETPESGSGNSDDKVVAGLSRKIEAQKKTIKSLTEQLAKQTLDPEAQRELETLKRDNAGFKTALKYPKVADVLSKAFERGLDPSLVDDDFVAALTPKETVAQGEPEEPATAHNPTRPVGTTEQDADRILKAAISL